MSKRKSIPDQVVTSQRDLARLAGVSLATMHNYFNRPEKVREITKQRIKQLIADLDYHPNQMARAMVKGRTYAIGVIVPRLDVAYYAKLFSSIERAANAKGYRCLACQHLDDPEKETAEINALRRWRVDGMIVRGCGRDQDDEVFRKLLNARLAFVQVDSLVAGIEKYCVLGDDRRDAKILVEHLIGKGHRRIAYFGFHRSGDFRLSPRYLGYLDALKQHGLPFDSHLTVELKSEYEGGHEEIFRLIQEGKRKQPTAVFAFNDHTALGVLNGLTDMKLRDIEVAGFGGYMESTAQLSSVTTIIQNTAEMGRLAFDLLDEQISDRTKLHGPLYVSGELAPSKMTREFPSKSKAIKTPARALS